MQSENALLTLRVVSFGVPRARYSLHAQYIAVASGDLVFLSGVAVVTNHRHLQTKWRERGTSDKLARRARRSATSPRPSFPLDHRLRCSWRQRPSRATQSWLHASPLLESTSLTRMSVSRYCMRAYMRLCLLSCDFRHLVYTHLTHRAKITSEYTRLVEAINTSTNSLGLKNAQVNLCSL